MAEPVQEYVFSHKEVVEALIKKQDLHDGIWMLSVRFGIGAMNAQRPGEEEIVPAAVVPVLSLGLRKVDALNPLALDAAQVNPPRPVTETKGRKKKQLA
jgi:hypothetical protein